MVRKLKMLLPLAMLIAAGQTLALGLGEIQLKSALNQPLYAEVEVLQEDGLAPGEILPTLAAVSDFDRAGIQREFFLSNLNFRIDTLNDGQMVMIITTNQSVQEPFLNFLVEVNWPSGRILKEFTLLLDPPLYDNAEVMELNDFTTTTSGSASSSQVEEFVTEEVIAEQSPVAVRQPEVLGPNQYRVKRNDTMWEIALRVRPDRTLTPQQVMLAIQEVNPEAFINSNINSVKAGSLLNIPSANDIQRWGVSEANTEVSRQYRAFRNPGSAGGAATVSASASTSSALPAGGEQDPEGYLELVGSGSSDAGSAAANDEQVAGLEAELTRALEMNDQFERENAELQSRLTDLQEQLDILQNLVNLQSDTAVVLANQDAIETDSETSSIDQLEQMLAQEITDTEVVATEPAEAMSTEEVTSPDAVALVESDENVAQQQQETQPVEAAVAQPEPQPAPVVAQPAVQTEEGFVQFLLNQMNTMIAKNPMYSIAGGLVLVLLLLLLLNSISKRHNASKGDSELDEGILDLEEDDDFSLDEADSSFDADANTIASDDTDFGLDDMAGDHDGGSESDAVGEADIYIAYGRYDQAEELLKTVIAEDPSNEEAKLKLAEVYVETGNRPGFDKIKGQLAGGSAAAAQALAELDAQMGEGGSIIENSEPAFGAMAQESFEPPVIEDSFATEDFPTLSLDEASDDDFGIKMDDELDFDQSGLDASFDMQLDDDSSDSAPSFSAPESMDPEAEAELDAMLSGGMEEDSSMGDSTDDISFDMSALSSGEDTAPAMTQEDAPSEDNDDLSFDMDFDVSGDLSTDDLTDLDDELGADMDLDSDLGSDLDLSSEFDGLGLDFESDTDAKVDPLAALDKQIEALSGSPAEEASEEEEKVEFDLSAFEDSADELPDTDSGIDLDEMGLDLENASLDDLEDGLSFEGLAETDSVEEAAAPEAELTDISLPEEPAEETELASADDLTSLEADDEFDLGELGDLGADMENMAADDDFDLLGGADEVSTKLDLARAYIDMEERDGAKEILEEVLKEGDQEQIQKAQDMLSELG